MIEGSHLCAIDCPVGMIYCVREEKDSGMMSYLGAPGG
ncbi:hypothetical protein CEB3_c06720 [Peptococcaceae bacterium CEB3]|nr:hypothetical protein CEB3_c06720 [Peptococcaceae bacterium CEB3]